MSEHHSSPSANPFSSSSATGGDSTLVRVGGSLGIAGCIIGMGIFIAACAGLGAAMALSPLSVAMGTLGLVLAVLGGVCKKAKNEVTHELASVAVSLFSILGGLIIMAAWLQWPVFYR